MNTKKESNFSEYAKSFQTVIELNLDSIKRLLSCLGSPHLGMKYFHVAGTNGKGSVCAFLEAMLVSDGYVTGRFSSPELISKNEMIRINGKNIPDIDLNELFKETEAAASKMYSDTGKKPSQFEIICACAFLYFKKENCDYVILEAGMGGEGDATNIIPAPVAAVITAISLDHTAYLGDTLEKIATVKSGIIKRGSVVITTTANEMLYSEIEKKCESVNTRLIKVSPFDGNGFTDIYEKTMYNGKEITLSLGGLNQLENAALAVKAAQTVSVKNESIICGLENCINCGRFEMINRKLIYDGAHNPSGAYSLKNNLERYFPVGKRAFVMGVMADKDFGGILDILKDRESRFFFVTVKNNPRALNAEDMAEIASKHGIDANICNNVGEAVKKAGNYADIITVCGSLYLYKELSQYISEENNENFNY